MLAWGTVLLVLYIGNWIWEGRAIQVSTTVLAVLIIYLAGLLVWLLRHESVRRGPPEPDFEPEPVPEASSGAMLAGLSVGAILFGVAWANFLVFFGAGMLVLALGRIVVELRAERAARGLARREVARQ
jgi:hypothetical protein